MTKSKELRKGDSTTCKIIKTILFMMTSLLLVHLGFKSAVDKTCSIMNWFKRFVEKIHTFIDYLVTHKKDFAVKFKCFIIVLIKSLIIVSLIMLVNYTNVRYQPAIVKGDSMSPTLNNGDVIIIDTWRAPKDGDILSISTDWITDYDNQADFIVKRYYENKSTTGYYVLGDNEEVSYDSRFFGEVSKKGLQGVVVYDLPGLFKDRTFKNEEVNH